MPGEGLQKPKKRSPSVKKTNPHSVHDKVNAGTEIDEKASRAVRGSGDIKKKNGRRQAQFTGVLDYHAPGQKQVGREIVV